MIETDMLLSCGAVSKKITMGETIFNEGTEAHFYYQLLIGSLRLVNIDEEGKEFIQNMVNPGECFGELPLFDEGLYAVSAIANKESIILRLHKESFMQILREDVSTHLRFSKMLSERLRFKYLLLKELAHHDPARRIVALLDYLKTSKKNICQCCNQVQLTRQQIADMTGLRVETVIRVITSLQSKGSLVIEKGKVYC